MMGIRKKADRTQIEMLSLDDLVPKNHLVRKIDAAIDLSFIYDEVKDLYKPYGRESIDPVVLIKIVMIQYLFILASQFYFYNGLALISVMNLFTKLYKLY